MKALFLHSFIVFTFNVSIRCFMTLFVLYHFPSAALWKACAVFEKKDYNYINGGKKKLLNKSSC